MNLPNSLTTVTFFSKILALVVILIFILSGFYAGTLYQKEVDQKAVYPTTQPASDKTTCTKDSDCILSEISNDTTATCCPNTRCLDLSKSNVKAVNNNWLNDQKRSICQGHYMCPMIYALCTKEITQANSHYGAKCESKMCVKVYK